jgi:hypothetical protein
MAEIEDSLTEEEKDELEQAAIDNERSKTKYGSSLSDDHRESDE